MSKEARRPTIDRRVAKILAVDPGFAELGWALVEVAGGDERARRMGVITTKPDSGKVLKAEDTLRRLRETSGKLLWIARSHSPDAIVFESLSIPQKTSKQNAIKIGHPYGILAMLGEVLDVPCVSVSPQSIKTAACGAQSASKDDVREAIARQFGDHEGPAKLAEEVAAGRQNHAWDALAAYVAARNTEVIRAVRRVGA